MTLDQFHQAFPDLFGGTGAKAVAPKRRVSIQPAGSIDELLVPRSVGNLRLHEEQRLSVDLYHALLAEYRAGRLRCTFSCVANELPIPSFTEQLRKIAVAIGTKRRAMGALVGTPDWSFIWPGGGGWVELKVPGGDPRITKVQRKNGQTFRSVKTAKGRLSPEQEVFRSWCQKVGVNHAVCTSVESVLATLIGWGALAAR